MVQGKASCGKTYLIKLMGKYVVEHFRGNLIEILAPTDVAANNISGLFCHFLIVLFKAHYLLL